MNGEEKSVSETRFRPKELKWKNHEAPPLYKLWTQQWAERYTPSPLSNFTLGSGVSYSSRHVSRHSKALFERIYRECPVHSFRRWAAAEGSLWISFVSRAAAQLLPSLLPSLAGEGWWLLVKKRKGPARLSTLYFHFIPSFTPVFSRPSKNNMPPFTDNIMSGYVDTWEEGWETVGRR